MDIHTFSMILGFPRFPIHRKMFGNVHIFNDSGLLTLHTPPKKSWRMCGNPYICNDSGLPTPPTPPKKFWKLYGNPYIFNDSGLPALPTPPKKSRKMHGDPGFQRFPLDWKNHEECMEIHTFWMILGSPRFPLHRIFFMYGNHAFSMILGFPRFPLHQQIFWKSPGNYTFSMIPGFPRFLLHRRNTWLWNGCGPCGEPKGTGGGGTRMAMRNRGHEVDPVEGTSSRKNIHRFFPRAAQGPHKDHWECMDFYVFFVIASVEWEAWEVQNHWKCMDLHSFIMISSVEW